MRYVCRRPLRGFTLVEILAALIVFGVALTAFVQAAAESARIQGELLDRQRAVMLAQNVLEEIRYTGIFEQGEDSGDFEEEDAYYRWRTDIRPNERFDGLLDIAVTIAWHDGREREYTLATQLVEPPDQPAGGAAQ